MDDLAQAFLAGEDDAVNYNWEVRGGGGGGRGGLACALAARAGGCPAAGGDLSQAKTARSSSAATLPPRPHPSCLPFPQGPPRPGVLRPRQPAHGAEREQLVPDGGCARARARARARRPCAPRLLAPGCTRRPASCPARPRHLHCTRASRARCWLTRCPPSRRPSRPARRRQPRHAAARVVRAGRGAGDAAPAQHKRGGCPRRARARRRRGFAGSAQATAGPGAASAPRALSERLLPPLLGHPTPTPTPTPPHPLPRPPPPTPTPTPTPHPHPNPRPRSTPTSRRATCCSRRQTPTTRAALWQRSQTLVRTHRGGSGGGGGGGAGRAEGTCPYRSMRGAAGSVELWR
jgi:hypothetical protein